VAEIHGETVCVGDCVQKMELTPPAPGQKQTLKLKKP
jgi:hypothetical protein